MSPNRRNALALPLALCAGLTLSMTAAAAEQPQPFVLTAYPTAEGGHELLAGRYPAALQQLRAQKNPTAPDAAAVSTNRCVALSMTAQWQAAQAACDTAVREADQDRFDTPTWAVWSSSSEKRLAAAYADRGVMRWLSDDHSGAQRDFAKAQALSPQSSFVTRNLTALKSHGTEVHTPGS